MQIITAENLIIAIDMSHGKDNTVLIVGRESPRKDIEIINAFSGKEALELYNKLTTVKEKVGK